MKEKKTKEPEMQEEKCTCGCKEEKSSCGCEDEKYSCGCGDECDCGPECDCGCNEGKDCTCGCEGGGGGCAQKARGMLRLRRDYGSQSGRLL